MGKQQSLSAHILSFKGVEKFPRQIHAENESNYRCTARDLSRLTALAFTHSDKAREGGLLFDLERQLAARDRRPLTQTGCDC